MKRVMYGFHEGPDLLLTELHFLREGIIKAVNSLMFYTESIGAMHFMFIEY